MNSIRSRLLVLLLPVTLAALAVTGVGIERTVSRDLRVSRDRQLLLLAQGIGSAVEMGVDGTVEFDLEEGDMPEFEESANESFYAVAGDDGGTLFASSDPPPGLFSAAGESAVFVDAEIDGEPMRVCLLSIHREPETDEEDRENWLEANPGRQLPAAEPRWLLVAAGLPDEEMRETLLLIRRRLLIGFGLLGALLLVFPAWVAGRSLEPLHRLSRQADEVGPERPDARLDEGGVDREVRSLVTALNRALDRLGGAYEQQKQFTADAAHELRSPLSAIRTQCEVSLRRERDGAELKEVLESVHRTALHMSGVVENLLSLSRLQNSATVIEKRDVDLAAIAREAVGLLMPLAKSRESSVEVELPGSITVPGNDKLLLECVSNLLDNAIRYTPEGGRITVSGGDGTKPWLSVSDNGEGIPEEHIGSIFERFYRIDPARSRSDGGSGLGLSISLAIARLHDADISVESRPGEGSRFTLAFGAPSGNGP